MSILTDEGQRIAQAAADRHHVSPATATSLLIALARSGGRQVQFNEPELGGMGQWSQGGMVMVGDMFNNGLKHRVDMLCSDLSTAVMEASVIAPTGAAGMALHQSSPSRWPADLGQPSSSGSQNDLHYAVFPATRRLAIDDHGQVSVYDTGDHAILGFSQQQGGGQAITFTSQHGTVRLDELHQIAGKAATEAASVPASAPAATPASDSRDDEIFSRLERLDELRKKGVITAEEFDSKKAELLARL